MMEWPMGRLSIDVGSCGGLDEAVQAAIDSQKL